MTETLVVDSSVAVKWYIEEEGSDRAESLLQRDARLVAPDLLLPEIGNVLWKRRGDLPREDVGAIVSALITACPVTLYPSAALLQGAVAIAYAYDRSVYDSLYLALAAGQNCAFVTADERLSNALSGTDLEQYIQVL